VLRAKCLALREVLVPEQVWLQFRQWHTFADDVAFHSSVVLLAFRRGYLPRVTGPARSSVRLSRIFGGRLVELQFASWLESQLHPIVGLEARHKPPDLVGPVLKPLLILSGNIWRGGNPKPAQGWHISPSRYLPVSPCLERLQLRQLRCASAYRTAIVTLLWLVAVPTVTCTGTLFRGATPSGMFTLI
jgi:hypothetical protein